MELVGCQIDVPEAVHVVHKKDLSLQELAVNTSSSHPFAVQFDEIDLLAEDLGVSESGVVSIT